MNDSRPREEQVSTPARAPVQCKHCGCVHDSGPVELVVWSCCGTPHPGPHYSECPHRAFVPEPDPNGPPPCVGVTCWPDRHQGECRWGPVASTPASSGCLTPQERADIDACDEDD